MPGIWCCLHCIVGGESGVELGKGGNKIMLWFFALRREPVEQDDQGRGAHYSSSFCVQYNRVAS